MPGARSSRKSRSSVPSPVGLDDKVARLVRRPEAAVVRKGQPDRAVVLELDVDRAAFAIGAAFDRRRVRLPIAEGLAIGGRGEELLAFAEMQSELERISLGSLASILTRAHVAHVLAGCAPDAGVMTRAKQA